MVVTRQTGWAVGVAGALALLGAVAGYYAIASPIRGIPSEMSERVLWTAAALAIGPFGGVAAGWWNGGIAWRRLAAAALMCGIVLGEGLHGLVRIERDGVQWWFEIVLGIG